MYGSVATWADVQEDRAALERSEGGKSTVVREVLATLESEGVDVTSDIKCAALFHHVCLSWPHYPHGGSGVS